MTGAMYAAIAGLKTHMNKLNVIGNNIANVNTYGYKTQRAIFSDSIYTTMSAGSDGTTTVGAVNPSQIGFQTGNRLRHGRLWNSVKICRFCDALHFGNSGKIPKL